MSPGVLASILVLGFASYRLTRLALFDRVLRGPRAFILVRLGRTADPPIIFDGDIIDGLNAEHAWELFSPSWRKHPAYFMKCSWCAGLWVTAVVCAAWHWAPVSRPLFVVAAVAGLQGLLHTWERSD